MKVLALFVLALCFLAVVSGQTGFAGIGGPNLGAKTGPGKRGFRFPNATTDPYHINIGTEGGGADVIADDVVLIKFSNDDALSPTQRMKVPADDDYTVFYATVTEDHDLLLQKPLVTVTSSDGEGVTATVAEFGKRMASRVPKVYNDITRENNATDLPITIRYSCLTESVSTIQVNIRVMDLADASKSHRMYSFKYLKECSGPDKTVKGSVLLGLSIGSSPNTKGDVMMNGEAREKWEVDHDDDTVEALVANHVVHSDFFVNYHSKRPLRMNRPQIVVYDNNVVEVEVVGVFSGQGTVLTEKKGPYRLTLQYTCLSQGESVITVALTSPMMPDDSFLFSFNKQCSGAEVFEGVAIQGLNVGTREGFKDVITDGITTDNFRNPISGEEEVDKQMVLFDEDEDVATFYVWTDSTTVEFKKPIMVIARTLDSDGLHIAKPKIEGTIVRKNSVSKGEYVTVDLVFNCQRDGMSDVSVEIPIKPSGSLQFVVEKRCAVASSFVPTNDVVANIPGLNVGLARHGASVVHNGEPQETWHWDTDVRDLRFLWPDKTFITFFFTLNATESDPHQEIRLGTPSLISTLAVAKPTIGGRGSDGAVISSDGVWTSVTVTFHCVANGTAQFNLEIPLLPMTVDDVAPRDEPIKISFLKKCASDSHDVSRGIGGIGITGLSVGTTSSGSDVVLNGFPTPLYFGQRHRDSPQWQPIIVSTDVESTRLYIHLNSKTGLSVDLDTVEFQSPVAVSHGHEIRPTLSGSAAAGGTLVMDKKVYELDITWNCRFAGLGVMSVSIPILPHGSISFTIPKSCNGPSKPQGKQISGLYIGTAKDLKNVIDNGLTQPAFQSYKAYELGSFVVYEDATSFWVWCEEDAVGALEPVVLSIRPIANPTVSHNMHVQEELGDEWEDATEIVIGAEPAEMVVTYHCVMVADTAITLILPILPRGSQVMFTWTLVCGGNDYDWGIDSYSYFGSYYNYFDDYYYAYYDDVYFMGSDEYFYYYSDYFMDDYYYFEYGGNYYYYNDWEDFDEVNWDPYFDEDWLYDAHPPLGWVNVGTGQDVDSYADVVENGVATSAYSLPNPNLTEDEDLTETTYTVIGRTREKSTFYISVPRGYQSFEPPSALPQSGKNGADICLPKIGGSALYGGNITAADAPVTLELEYNCQRSGVTRIVVTIPLLPTHKFISYRIIKVCGNFETKVEWYWTAPRILILGSAILGVCVAIFLYFYFKGRKSHEYTLVSSNDNGGRNVGARHVAMDNFEEDIDSESD